MSGNTSASEGFVERWLGDLSDIEKAFSQEVRLVNSKQGAFTRGRCSISKKFWDQSDYYISLGDDSNAQKFLDGLYKTLAKIELKPTETQFTIFVKNVFSREYAELTSFSCDEINNNLDQESEGSRIKVPHHPLMESTDTGFDLGLVIYLKETTDVTFGSQSSLNPFLISAIGYKLLSGLIFMIPVSSFPIRNRFPSSIFHLPVSGFFSPALVV